MTALPGLPSLLKNLKDVERKFPPGEQKRGFNIFAVLRNEYDEVNLHSAFLFELLNPHGSHGMGRKFLEHFIKRNNVPVPTANMRVIVAKEERSALGRIDIRIESGPDILIIENKILSGDGNKQLERYFDEAKRRGYRDTNIHIFYLTLHGNGPSRESLGRLLEKQVICISYVRHIYDWLAICIGDAALHPTLRETLVQYQNLINNLTRDRMTDEKIDEIEKLLADGDNAVLAQSILETWPHIKWRATWKFLTELEAKLKALKTVFPEFELEDGGYSEQDMNRMFFNKKPGEIDFCIEMLLCKLTETTGLCLAVGYARTDHLYVGLFVRGGEGRRVNHGGPEFETYVREISCFHQDRRNESWLNWKSISCRQIELLSFEHPDTLALANDEKRRKIIDEVFAEIAEVAKEAVKPDKLTLLPREYLRP